MPCAEGAPGVLCLAGDRFEVRADWSTGTAQGQGTGERLTADTGYFWFFRDSNVEVVVKVLDGCAVNGHHWVFAAGLTDVGVSLSIRDTQSEDRRYENPRGTPFQPIQDTAAFPCQVEEPPPGPGWVTDWSRDTQATELRFDLATRRATARITLSPSPSTGASFAVGDLEVDGVTGPAGPRAHRVVAGAPLPGTAAVGRRLDVAVPPSEGPLTLEVAYRFQRQDDLAGFVSTDGGAPRGTTYVWPYLCGNLFPCDPDPADGFTFDVMVAGAPASARVVAPPATLGDGPPYMPAFAYGDYIHHHLGTTEAGTRVGLWALPSFEAVALGATADLPQVFSWLEATYGPYPFGADVASVVVDWGPGVGGGIEHHPFWHVALDSAGDAVIHAHEAAHGWFGNGVRIACWQDFVLSEGLATYLAARALEAVRGAEAGDAVWNGYRQELLRAVASGDTVARPPGCGGIDILDHPLWSAIPYYKGAFFLRSYESEAGRAALDSALASFFAEHAGGATTVAALLDHLEAATGVDPVPLAEAWLYGLGIPGS